MEKVLSVNGQPLNVSGRIPRLSWRLQAGHSYFAFSATTQIVTQKQLEEMSGVSQPVIARLERGTTSPNISTVMKLLAPLGKKLAIVPLES